MMEKQIIEVNEITNEGLDMIEAVVAQHTTDGKVYKKLILGCHIKERGRITTAKLYVVNGHGSVLRGTDDPPYALELYNSIKPPAPPPEEVVEEPERTSFEYLEIPATDLP